MSLRIAWDARLLYGTSTGDSTHWTGLYEALRAIPDDSQFIFFSDQPAPLGFLETSRFTWRQVFARSSRWWSLVAFPKAARREGVDMAHVQYSLSPLFTVPAIATVHDVSFLIEPSWFSKRDRTLLTLGVRTACSRAARVITVSHTGQAEIERLLPQSKGKVRVVDNACPSWIKPVEPRKARELIANEFGFEGPYVLTVGTRWPRKNMRLAVDAVDTLPERLPHKLLVTGKAGWGDMELGGRGIATGYVGEDLLSALYSAADVYLAPSRHEGFGIPVLEAYRCGCPVLCSTGGALPEVAGGAAMLESSWEPAAWRDDLVRMLDDPGTLDSLRNRGRARERDYTWDKAARQLLAVYREVAA